MAHQELIIIEKKHVGRKVVKALGKRWRLGSRILAEDVGKHIHRSKNGGIELREDREVVPYPWISKARDLLNLNLFVDSSDGTCSLVGMLPEEGTPWFDTIDELEEFVEENIDTLIREITVN